LFKTLEKNRKNCNCLPKAVVRSRQTKGKHEPEQQPAAQEKQRKQTSSALWVAMAGTWVKVSASPFPTLEASSILLIPCSNSYS